MKRIKNYEDFQNEEINLKKALTGAALAGSLLLSPTTKAFAETDVLTSKDRIELSEVTNAETLFTKKITVSGTKKEISKKN